MRAFVTGTAGFIGFHLAKRLLAEGHAVIGYDGLTPYYDLNLKQRRHAQLKSQHGFTPIVGMLEDKALLCKSIAEARPDVIFHLAAQAGVRHSLEDPDAYGSSNLVGTLNLLEAARAAPPRHLLFASTSSVYGSSEKVPFIEADATDRPVSLYAASKKAGEAMTHAYAHLFSLPTTCFRFFTVYGPWGRPDMALYRFVEAIEAGRTIDVFGEGRMLRDFTYVDDLVQAVLRLAEAVPQQGAPVSGVDSLSPIAPWRVVNVGGAQPVSLIDFIAAIESALGKSAQRRLLPMQPGDVPVTAADVRLLRALTGDVPTTPLDHGIRAFVDWYRSEISAIEAGSQVTSL